MPRIDRKIRVRPQNRVTRAQILELLIGPNGKTVFASEAEAQALWADLQTKYSPTFARNWYAAGNRVRRFADIAVQYAKRVVAGEILACKWTKLACRRHLDDLTRAHDVKWKYEFDISKAERVCRFLELLPHVKGNWAANAELMVLQPWQIFIVCALFGWVKRASRMRRFAVAYIKIPRKNGKSQLAAGIGLYMFACDGEFGAEVYSGATTENQAYEVFRPAVQMIDRSPELAQALGVLTSAKKISRPEDGNRFQVVVGKPGDGASPHCGIADEYHEHDTDSLVDTFRTGMGARLQALLFIITTAGTNTAGPCKLLEDDVCKLLDSSGKIERDELFGILYGLDAGDSWTSENALRKANPNLDVSVFQEFLVAELHAAIISPRKQGIFRTKHLNVWVGALVGFFDMEKLNAAADNTLKSEALLGELCVIADDLATKRDFTARVKLFKRSLFGKSHYYLFCTLYLPQAQVDREDAPHYKDWAAAGYIKVHPGATVDFDVVKAETIAEVNQYHAAEFAFDPWNAADLAQAVGKATSAEVVEIPQNAKNLSASMKELDVAIAEGRVHHDGNPALIWMFGNVMSKEDANENVFPRKEAGRAENKIDGAVASIMAMSRAMVLEPQFAGIEVW